METPQWALERIRKAVESKSTDLDLSERGGLGDIAADIPLSEVPESVFEMTYLKILNLRGHKLRTLPAEIANLENLEELYLDSNFITDLPNSIEALKKLTTLDLDNNQLDGLPRAIFKLNNLEDLYLSKNRIAFLPEYIANLQNLITLILRENQLISFTESITKLKNLTTLELGKNHITSLPDTIMHLKKLKTLDLSNNSLISLPETIVYLEQLNTLHLNGNPLTIPPVEIAYQGIHSVRDYFRQLGDGKDYLYEAKLLILGEGGAGKTTLAKKIENQNYQLIDEEKSTEGVAVTQWFFPMGDKRSFRVNIWDFGGQEIYHATHQFFLTKRSLYALVADSRKEDTDFYYWLNVIELLSDGSPLLIVKNEKQDRQRELNQSQLRGHFGNLKDVLAANFATDRGLKDVKDKIQYYIQNLPHIGSPLPKKWVIIREKLEKNARNYISLEDYLDICKENGFVSTKDSLQLSSYLHDIGVFLHFQDDPLLSKTVILKPKWGTDAVYKVLDNKEVIKNLGKFTKVELALIWNLPEYEYMQNELLQLMVKFRLCYRIPAQNDVYIAPQLLTENQPVYVWNKENNLFLRYTYEFMPKGMLFQFIVVMSDYIWREKVWRSGVVLEKENTRAEVVEHYVKREIHIRISGLHKKELMTILLHELDKIQANYRRLKYSKLIPCNCTECKEKKEPYFYRFEVLQKFVEDREEKIQCQQSYKMVNTRALIDDVIDWKSEKDIEDSIDKKGRYQRGVIQVGDNFNGNIIIESNVEDSFNRTIQLQKTLDELGNAIQKMSEELPYDKAVEVKDDFQRLVEESNRVTPNPKWYKVSINGLTKAAENLGRVGEPVIELSRKLLSLLTIGAIK